MKDKFSDNTSSIDNPPERNQESTEKSKIKLLDVVALTHRFVVVRFIVR